MLAFEQASRWKPRLVSVAEEADAEMFRSRLKAADIGGVEVTSGSQGAVAVATHPEVDFVVSAIVGVAGLEATYEAVQSGQDGRTREQRMPGGGRRVNYG